MYNGRIFVCADLHGNAKAIYKVIAAIDNPTEQDIIIVAGDAGFEYQDYIMGQAKKAAKQFPGIWIVMRGNHDSCYWREHTDISKASPNHIIHPNDDWELIGGMDPITGIQDCFLRQKKYPNIWYFNDNGGICTIGNCNFLFLPGAYSVDKNYRRRMGYPYNPQEQLSTNAMNELWDLVQGWNTMDFPIDYVIGHTFPLKIEPYYRDLFMRELDQSMIDKRTEQWLDRMAELFEKNSAFKKYYGGHFHNMREMTDKYMMVYQYPLMVGED